MIEDAPYWIALAHLPRWRSARINELIIKFFHENSLSPEDFLGLPESDWKEKFDLNTKEVEDLNNAKSKIPDNSFLAESLYNQGFELIPITSPDYSKTLKNNLKTTYSPILLYIKGDKQILTEDSVAIVGSRNASEKSLKFTDNIAYLASKEFKVVVSGFAKGVDKQALDSAIKHIGRSIIVLPQGVLTFGSGYKTYDNQILEGNVLVLSTFFPKAPWSVELAMARNSIIYGLANEIYVAESDEKGGTWSGVTNGLKKGRNIYVRMPDESEINANKKLIQMGATAVDYNGKKIKSIYESNASAQILTVNEDDTINKKIKNILQNKSLSSKEILSELKLNWSSRKLSDHLKKLDFVEVIKQKGINKYKIKTKSESEQINLF